MALPVTIADFKTTANGSYTSTRQSWVVGPYKNSAGNYYVVGFKPEASADSLIVKKATDPTSSFSTVTGLTQTGITADSLSLPNTVRGYWIAAAQGGDTLHIIVVGARDSSNTNGSIAYWQLNMSTESWAVSQEGLGNAFNFRDEGASNEQRVAASVVVTSTGDVKAILPRNANAIMGTDYTRLVYMVRSSGSWGSAVDVDAGGPVAYYDAEAVLGSSDRVHFFWKGSDGNIYSRTLTSANSLQTATSTADTNAPESSVSYNDGTQRVVAVGESNSYRFNSADTYSITESATGGTTPARVFHDDGNVYVLYRDSSTGDLYVKQSTDDGATWGSASTAFGSITVANSFAALSHDGAVYQRGNDYVIPYVVNDNGTWKYNEYVVRSGATAIKKRYIIVT